MRHIIRLDRLQHGALEIEYLEQYFDEFKAKKCAEEVIARMQDREHLILFSMAPSPDDETHLIPVSFKVGHELRADEKDSGLAQLVDQLQGCAAFAGHKVFYSWLGGTRQPWRGQGHYRALTEQQEEWSLIHGYHEMVVKTKNKFYPMRATLDHLHFNVIKLLPNPEDSRESKLYLSKIIGKELLQQHQTERTLVESV